MLFTCRLAFSLTSSPFLPDYLYYCILFCQIATCHIISYYIILYNVKLYYFMFLSTTFTTFPYSLPSTSNCGSFIFLELFMLAYSLCLPSSPPTNPPLPQNTLTHTTCTHTYTHVHTHTIRMIDYMYQGCSPVMRSVSATRSNSKV